MKIVCIGNYPPRKCGIATFTKHLLEAVQTSLPNAIIEVVAMNDGLENYAYPAIVKKVIHDNNHSEYKEAADYINQSKAAICLVQHEYGIFGGASGVLLLQAIKLIQIPVVVTLHTVLDKPNFHQKEVLIKLAEYASSLIVMNKLATYYLENIYGIPAKKITVIPHGVPNFNEVLVNNTAIPRLWKNKKVMLTFGLIGRSKGIEVVIKALTKVVDKHPNILYVIMGKTHPHVIRHAGEEYRQWLESLVIEHNLSKHVHFINEYIEEAKLVEYLTLADIYVTPYHNKTQVTSGTLSYGLASGCAVISTPYWHATELLQNNTGLLFDFGNSADLAEKINLLLENPGLLKQYQAQGKNVGAELIWQKVGHAYTQLLAFTIENGQIPCKLKHTYNINYDDYFKTTHLLRLTDDTGILQHAKGATPNFKMGYCLDDNARALLLSIYGYTYFKTNDFVALAHKYLSFIYYVSQKNGSFDNFVTYQKTIYPSGFSEDAYGRTIWALGCLINQSPNDSLFELGMELWHKSIGFTQQLTHTRGYANCIFGLSEYIRRFPDQETFIYLLNYLATKLCQCYSKHAENGNNWFDGQFTYDNGLLPAALFKAYEITRNEQYLTFATKTMHYLEEHCFMNEHLSPIGTRKWQKLADDEYDLFAQQPIDVFAMIWLYQSAYIATGNKEYQTKKNLCFQWFLGNNDLEIPVYDMETGGCNDGLEEFGVNRNQGAESTLAYMLSWFIVQQGKL